jgi:hypothetical protein
VIFAAITFVLLLNECLLSFLLFISISTQSGNFWIHLLILPPHTCRSNIIIFRVFYFWNVVLLTQFPLALEWKPGLPTTVHPQGQSHSTFTHTHVGIAACITSFTYVAERSPFRQRNSRSAGQEISHLLWNPKVHYRVHNIPPMDIILRQFNPVHKFTHTISFKSILISVYLHDKFWREETTRRPRNRWKVNIRGK